MPVENLDRLRAELDSLSHERVVMDVLTRDMIRDSKLGQSSRKSSTEVAKTKYSELVEPIAVPEYDGEHITSAARLLERNMSDLLIGKKQVRNPSDRALSVRNTALGFVVPGARAGIPEEVAAMVTRPSSTPFKRSGRYRKNIGNDAIYGLLSEELQHRNTALRSELGSMRAKLDELSKKRHPRSRNWSKGQLGGLIDAVISKYVSQTEKQPQSTLGSNSERLRFPTFREVGVGAKLEEHHEPHGQRFDEPRPKIQEIPSEFLEGYKVLVARKDAFQPAVDKQAQDLNDSTLTDAVITTESQEDDLSEDALLGAQLAGVDGDFVLEGRKDGVRWVQCSGRFHRPSEVGVQVHDPKSEDANVVVIHGQKLIIPEEDALPERRLIQHSARQPQASAATYTRIEVKPHVEEVNVSTVDKLFPRMPWPILSSVQPLRKLQEDSQPEPTALNESEVLKEEESVRSGSQSENTTSVDNQDDHNERIKQMLELVQALIMSNQNSANSNHEVVMHLLKKNENSSGPVDELPKSLLQFYTPLTRVGIRVFLEEFNAQTLYTGHESSSRRLKKSLLFRALHNDKEFSEILSTDSHYEGLTSDFLYDKLSDTEASKEYIAIHELVTLLENASLGIAQADIRPSDAGDVVPQQTSPAEIVSALANAISGVADAISAQRVVEPTPIDPAFIESLVKNGITEGLATALTLTQRQQAPVNIQHPRQDLEISEDESFITYQGSLSNSTLSSGGDIEPADRPRHRLLHSNGLGLGRSYGEKLTSDKFESEILIQRLRDDQHSETTISSSRSASSLNRKSKYSRKNREQPISPISDDSSPLSNAENVVSKKKLTYARWDMNGRKICPTPLVRRPLISRKAGCHFTRAAQDLNDESSSSADGSIASSSKTVGSRAAIRYRDMEVVSECIFESKSQSSRSVSSSQIDLSTRSSPKNSNVSTNDVPFESDQSSSDSSSVVRKVATALKLSKHVRLR